MQSEPTLLTRKEATEVLRIGLSSLDEAIRRKEIPVVRLGRRILIPRLALERMIVAATQGEQS